MEQQHEAIVAVVDDDDDVGEVLRGLLESAGYQIMIYKSAREFLPEAQLGQVACLVVDQNMPGMTGLELLTELSARGIAMPSLLISGGLEAGVADRALELGVMKVLDKPMDSAELLRFISFAVG
jgi:FixJ family two-component response regulator